MTGTPLCTQDISNVKLTNGVFHVKLNFDCTVAGKSLTQVLSQTPTGESVAIRITDLTHSKQYSYQALHALPNAIVAEQLPQMGASTGHALKWDGTKWWPSAVGTGNGSVTTINTGSGLTGGPISTTGTISIANSGVGNAELANNAVTAAKINAGEISNSHISGAAAIDYSKLNIGIGEIPQDRINGLVSSMSSLIEDVINDAVTGKAPSQNAVYDALALKAERSNITQNITAASVTGLTGPIAGSDAANKTYVDNAATTVDTRVTTEVATLNTSLGNKYDKSGGVITGDVTLNTQLHLKGGANAVTVKANAATVNYVLTLPTSAGTSGYVLQTDGSGNTSWVTPAVGSSSITDGSIVDADIHASAGIAQSKISNLTTDLAGKQPLISAGTTAQYYRGDKTFVDLATDVRGTVLTGYAVGTNTALTATDTTLSAFQNLQGQINATNTAVAGKEASLTAGSTSQYYRGDKSWQTLDGAVVANTAAGNIAATNVQNAINELDSEKQDKLTSTSTVDSRELRFYELPGNGTFYSSLKSPDDLTANINYVLPVVAPTAGQVLSSSAAGVMSWITIPSAPVTTVHGRSGAVVSANGDYTASQITNTPAGTIAATTVQAALNELDGDKQATIAAGTTAQYYRGDKTWATFATDAINSVLSTFAVGVGTKPAVTNTDTVVGAFGKVQKTLNDINADYISKTQDNTIFGALNVNSTTGFITVPTPLTPNDAANKAYVDGLGWIKSGSDVYHLGKVGIGTSSPNASAVLDLSSTSKGFLPPRMTTAQRDALVAPAAGLTIYNTTVNQLQVYDGATWAGASGSSTQEVNQGAGVNLASGPWTDILSMTVTSGGKFLIMANGNNIASQPWTYFSVGCRLYVGASIVDEKYFYYGGSSGGSGPGMPMFHYAIRTLNSSDIVKISCYVTSDSATRTSSNWKISLVSLGVTNASGGGADNLGNHILSQNLILGSNWLSGDGDPEGIKLDGSGNVGIGVATPLAPLHVAGSIKSGSVIGNTVTNVSGQQMEPGDATLTTLRFDSAAYRIWNVVYGEVMRVLSSGRIGINTTTPQATLDVNGAIKMGSQATCDAATEGTQRYNSTTKQMEFCNGSSWNAMGANAVPSGAVSAYAQSTCPAGWIKANGQAISRATYANLFAAVGTTYGGGDGSTTFNVPELRGEFIRGWDDGRGVDSGRTLGSAQNATRVLRSYWGDGGWEGAVPDIMGHASTDYDSNERAYDGANAVYPNGPVGGPAGAHVDGIRVRPRNKALLFCIKS